MRVCILASALCTLASIAGGQPQPGFDPKAVVRQMPNSELRHRRASPTEARPRRDFPTPAPRHPTADFDDGEFLIDTSRSTVPSPFGTNVAVATDGSGYLIIWEDRRGGDDVFAGRLTSSGKMLDSLGIRVSAYSEYLGSPAAAFGDGSYLVVWPDARGGISGARVTASGVLLDSSGIAINRDTRNVWWPSVAFDGDNFLVVWNDDVGHDMIRGARVSGTGILLDTQALTITETPDWVAKPKVAFSGGIYLVVWPDYRNVALNTYCCRISRSGEILDSSGIGIAPNNSYTQDYPDVSANGAEFMIVWQDEQPRAGYIHGARVLPDGGVRGGIQISPLRGYQERPLVAFDGNNYLATWNEEVGDSHYVYTNQVTQSGHVPNPSGAQLFSGGAGDLASNGTNYLVTSELNLYRVDTCGILIDTTPIFTAYSSQRQVSPAGAFGAGTYLIVWQDNRGPDQDIYGSRVSEAGAVLDPAGLAVTTAPGIQESPATAFDGSNFLVVWLDHRTDTSAIYGCRVAPNGAVLDPEGIRIGAGVGPPAVTFDDSTYLVLWESDRVRGARINRQGVILDSTFHVVGPGGPNLTNDFQPAIAFDGANNLVAWVHLRMEVQGIYHYYYYSVRGEMVSALGQVLDTNPIQLAPERMSTPYYLLAAFDGMHYLAVWPEYNGVSGRRIATSGQIIDTNAIVIDRTSSDPSVSLAFDGTHYIVARTRGDDIYGSQVTPSGNVSGSFPMVVQSDLQTSPALVAGGQNRVLLAYSGWAGIEGGRQYNSMRIWGKLGPFGAVQETPGGEMRKISSLPTVVRGMMEIGPQLAANSLRPGIGLYDINGHRVAKLHAGANDVSRLSPGVYFVRDSTLQAQPTKIVVIR